MSLSPQDNVPLSVIVPAHQRVGHLRRTLQEISRCRPAPAEILSHVDGETPEVMKMLAAEFPDVRVLGSRELAGPGGARNRLVEAAQHELVANFDDDSYPRHPDYFQRALATAELFPNAAVISACGLEETDTDTNYRLLPMANGCGCIFRKSWYERVGGFVPLPVAYGMEEADMGLRFFEIGGEIIHDPRLRVLHDHVRTLEEDRRLVPGVFANTALLCYLRYPLLMLPLALGHVLSHALSTLRGGMGKELLKGLSMVLSHLQHWRGYRRTVRVGTVLRWIAARREQPPVFPA